MDARLDRDVQGLAFQHKGYIRRTIMPRIVGSLHDNEFLYGSISDDLIIGDVDILDRQGASDHIYAGDGADTVYGDATRMVGYAVGGKDAIYGGGGNDLLYGDAYSMEGYSVGG